MYPPREDRAEERHPANPLKSSIVAAWLFLGFAAVISLANRSLLSGAWLFVLAGIEGADAIMIRCEAEKAVRIAVRIAWLPAAIGIWLMWRLTLRAGVGEG